MQPGEDQKPQCVEIKRNIAYNGKMNVNIYVSIDRIDEKKED